jgi:hypothetical protein
MPKSPSAIPTNPRMAAVHAFGHPSAPAPRTGWAQQGRAQTSTPGTPHQAAPVPNAPPGVSLAQGTGSDLIATWAAPATDSVHAAATGYNLRFRSAGAGTWATVTHVASPYDLAGLTAGTAFDVQIQSSNAAGVSLWSPTGTLTTAAPGPFAPNAPAISSAAPPPDGTATKITVAWTAPATDATHGAASGYNLRYSAAGAGSWTTVTGVTSPSVLTGLSGSTAIDIELQGTNAAASAGPWSSATTATTWGATVAPGNWVPASTQTHGASVAPNGGAQLVAVAAPTAVTGAAFAWSASNSAVPTSGLISGGGDGQSNGWGQWFNAPSIPGTYYLWLLAQGTGSVTTGALVTGPIAVS